MFKAINIKGYVISFVSAFLYGLNVPISKYFLNDLSSSGLLFIMYFGSALGIFLIILFNKKQNCFKAKKEEIPYISGIVASDIIASLLILTSLKYLNASVVSLLSILEIGFTIMISWMIFGNKINKNLIISLFTVTIGGILLSLNGNNDLYFSVASFLVLGAALLWGFENNLTAKVSQNNPLLLVFYKCLFVALFNGLITCFNTNIIYIITHYWYLLIIGFFTYGISILCFALGTKYVGASKTSIIFSLSPIFSTLLSLIIFKDNITTMFVISFLLMLVGIYFTIAKE